LLWFAAVLAASLVACAVDTTPPLQAPGPPVAEPVRPAGAPVRSNAGDGGNTVSSVELTKPTTR
jgi:hypothetical protein